MEPPPAGGLHTTRAGFQSRPCTINVCQLCTIRRNKNFSNGMTFRFNLIGVSLQSPIKSPIVKVPPMKKGLLFFSNPLKYGGEGGSKTKANITLIYIVFFEILSRCYSQSYSYPSSDSAFSSEPESGIFSAFQADQKSGYLSSSPSSSALCRRFLAFKGLMADFPMLFSRRSRATFAVSAPSLATSALF